MRRGRPYFRLDPIPYHYGLSVGNRSGKLSFGSVFLQPLTLPVATERGSRNPGKDVKVLLRNTSNGWYYQGASKWTPRQEEALDLGQLSWAVEVVFQARLENVEILLAYEDPQHNLVLPIDRLQQKIASGELDLTGEPFVKGEESPETKARKKPPL
jgi:hypothetical protein